MRSAQRDVTRSYPRKQFIEKLRRLADALEAGQSFRIQVGNVRVQVPSDAEVSVEHERSGEEEELELQLRWTT